MSYNSFLREEVVNIVETWITKAVGGAKFRDQIRLFCEMAEEHGKEIEKFRKLAENDPNFQKQRKILNQQIEEYKQGKRSQKPQRPKPPKPHWVWYTWYEDYYPASIPVLKSTFSFYTPPDDKLAPNPIKWLGFAERGRDPTNAERLMCDYVLLAVLHDEYIRKDSTGMPIYLDQDYQGKWFNRDAFFRNLWWSYDNEKNQQKQREKKAKIERALEHVKADLETEKPEEEKNKVIFKKLIKIIGTIIVGLFIAFLADILGDLGWTKRIAEFIYRLFSSK